MKCKRRNKCPFYKAYGYCIKDIGEDCKSNKERNNNV